LAQGLKPGPELGVVLARLEALWVDSAFELTKDDLIEAALKP
jgi:poly(A) polymerase